LRSFNCILITLVLTVLLAPPAFAQFTGEGFEMVLLPLATKGETLGGYGSRWVTHLGLFNGTDREISWPNDIRDLGGCLFPPCPTVRIPAKSYHDPVIYHTEPGKPPGALLYIRDEIAADVRLSVRIQDLSRQALTWGTEIPVVREVDLLRGTFYLWDIPLDSRFRQSLRVYDPLPHEGCRMVRIRLLDQVAGAVLWEEVASLRDSDCRSGPGSNFPAAMEWHDLSDRIGLTTGKMVAEITPLEPDMAIWGFITVINNETQHVTTITPE
jgi:hypothetical protein